MTSPKICRHVSALALTVLLAACGGGGSGGSSAPATATPADQPPVGSVPAPTYSAGTEEVAAFQLLNAERSRCGFGLLAQNAQLDQAAQAHADWSLRNDQMGHYESSSLPNGYSGVTPGDRAAAAGYVTSYGVGEGIAYDYSTNKTGFGGGSVRGLLSAPYHQYTLLAPTFMDVGLSIRSPADAGAAVTRVHANFNLGTKTGFQYLSASEVVSYPCDGTTGVNYQLQGENPNPVPGRDLVASPLGHPVMLMVRYGQPLVISSATMTKVSNSSNIPLRAPISATNDPNNVFQSVGGHVGYVIPDGPLEPSTSYYVTINGTNAGTPFTRQFTFTTGTGG